MYKQQTIFSAFRHAFNGLWYFFLHERNGKVQCVAAIGAIGCGWLLAISAAQWICILLCIGAVLSLEMMNSALEKLCDVVQEDYHPAIKIVKDVAAGAVLWASVVSIVIACFIYLPKIYLLCIGN
jgi:diacylglycerol kinase